MTCMIRCQVEWPLHHTSRCVPTSFHATPKTQGQDVALHLYLPRAAQVCTTLPLDRFKLTLQQTWVSTVGQRRMQQTPAVHPEQARA
jgi:hypothetical protein